MFLVMAAGAFLFRIETGQVKPLFQPTPTPTRIPQSYIMEADAYFASGKIDDPNSEDDAIDTYRRALQEDPENARVWGQLARVLTYSSTLLTTNDQRRERLQEAREAADQAAELAPEDGNILAIRAFVYDWNASYASEDTVQDDLTEALNSAVRAIQLDPNDGLALAFYAEVQLDQQKWDEAQKYAVQAVEMNPELMDTHRVYALLLESLGNYRQAIEEYETASSIAPNLTFLYIQIGINYRYLGLRSNYYPPNENPLYFQALEYFQKAAQINEQNGVKEPTPYIAIAKTYSQMGEFFAAANNAEKALSLNSTDATSYGELGIIYFKSRNYESSQGALKCAVEGCSANDNLVLNRLKKEKPYLGVEPVAVQGLKLDRIEVAYYYAEYGQVLAYLSRTPPKENFCAEAYTVLQQVRNFEDVDSVLLQIATESEGICHRLEGSPSETAP
jgi:tetratricopeptide (TPR) repeat protein